MANLIFSNGGKSVNDTLPEQVTNLKSFAENGSIRLTWTNPTSYFNGVLIVVNNNNIPENINDGTTLYNGTLQQYVDFVTNGTKRYYRFFPYNSKGQFQTSIVGGTTANVSGVYSVYGIKIDTNNSNPETSVTYTDDAIGLVPSLGNNGNFIDNGWETRPIYKDLRPCLFKDGVVQYYLNKNDYTKKEDGTPSDIITGNDGDVMIEIPKMAYAIYYDDLEDYIYVKITNHPMAKILDSNFCYYGHTRDVEGDRDNLYVGAYIGGYELNGTHYKLTSLSNQTFSFATTPPFNNTNYYNGTRDFGYDRLSFYPLILLQCLYLIRYKNLNSRNSLGEGKADTVHNYNITTGTTNTYGMNYGTNNITTSIKCNGIEDLWGNSGVIIEGTFLEEDRILNVSFNNFNINGTGYIKLGEIMGDSFNNDAYTIRVFGNNNCGFMPKLVNTQSSNLNLYFSAFNRIYRGDRSVLIYNGMSFGISGYLGMFSLSSESMDSTSNFTYRFRLMYL